MREYFKVKHQQWLELNHLNLSGNLSLKKSFNELDLRRSNSNKLKTSADRSNLGSSNNLNTSLSKSNLTLSNTTTPQVILVHRSSDFSVYELVHYNNIHLSVTIWTMYHQYVALFNRQFDTVQWSSSFVSFEVCWPLIYPSELLDSGKL